MNKTKTLHDLMCKLKQELLMELYKYIPWLEYRKVPSLCYSYCTLLETNEFASFYCMFVVILMLHVQKHTYNWIKKL